MSEMGLYRTLWLAPVVGTLTAFRVGVGVGQIWGAEAHRLVHLGMDSWSSPQAAEDLQRELYQLARQSSTAASETITNGIDRLEDLAGR